MASKFENNQEVSGEFRKKQYEHKSAVDLSAELTKGEQTNNANKERQDSINNTSIANNTAAIKSKEGYYGAAANNYNASAGMTRAQTVKQGLDNAMQTATQPGIINAVNVGSDSKIAQLRTTKTAAQDMQSDMMRSAIGKGFQVGADGGIGNSVGDFLPGAGARIRGELSTQTDIPSISKEITELKESTKTAQGDSYYETNPGKIMESERGQPLGDIPGSLGFKDTRGRGRQLRSPEKLAVAGSRALAGVAGNYLMNIDKGFK